MVDLPLIGTGTACLQEIDHRGLKTGMAGCLPLMSAVIDPLHQGMSGIDLHIQEVTETDPHLVSIDNVVGHHHQGASMMYLNVCLQMNWAASVGHRYHLVMIMTGAGTGKTCQLMALRESGAHIGAEMDTHPLGNGIGETETLKEKEVCNSMFEIIFWASVLFYLLLSP